MLYLAAGVCHSPFLALGHPVTACTIFNRFVSPGKLSLIAFHPFHPLRKTSCGQNVLLSGSLSSASVCFSISWCCRPHALQRTPPVYHGFLTLVHTACPAHLLILLCPCAHFQFPRSPADHFTDLIRCYYSKGLREAPFCFYS